jgi:hypothetical protein
MADTLIYRVSPWKAVMVVLGSLAFVLAGWWMRHEHPWVGWASILFFGFCGLAGLWMLLAPRSVYLQLDARGLLIASPFRRQHIPWAEIADFEIVSIKGSRMIAIHYLSAPTAGRQFSAAVSGIEGAIPNSYAARLEDILQSLQTYLHRYRGAKTLAE